MSSTAYILIRVLLEAALSHQENLDSETLFCSGSMKALQKSTLMHECWLGMYENPNMVTWPRDQGGIASKCPIWTHHGDPELCSACSWFNKKGLSKFSTGIQFQWSSFPNYISTCCTFLPLYRPNLYYTGMLMSFTLAMQEEWGRLRTFSQELKEDSGNYWEKAPSVN